MRASRRERNPGDRLLELIDFVGDGPITGNGVVLLQQHAYTLVRGRVLTLEPQEHDLARRLTSAFHPSRLLAR